MRRWAGRAGEMLMGASRKFFGAASAAFLLLCGAAKAADAPPSPNQYSDLHWRLIGPFRGGWAEMIEGVPDKPDTYLFAASGGGVWRTDNSGRTWRSVFDQGPAPVGALAHFFGPSQARGVFRSTDGGKTWSQTLKIDDWTGVADLSSDPADPNTLFAASWTARQWPWQSYFTKTAGQGSGLWKSTD